MYDAIFNLSMHDYGAYNRRRDLSVYYDYPARAYNFRRDLSVYYDYPARAYNFRRELSVYYDYPARAYNPRREVSIQIYTVLFTSPPLFVCVLWPSPAH